MEPEIPESETIKDRTRLKASRMHQGSGHWHVRVRSSVIICGECDSKIPKSQRPAFCPACGAGRA